MSWKIRQLVRELRAWANYRDEVTARRDIEALAREHGGAVAWDTDPSPLPELRAAHETGWDRVVYRGEPMTRDDAERHRQWDNLLGLRAEARRLIRELDHEEPLAMFSQLRRLLEE